MSQLQTSVDIQDREYVDYCNTCKDDEGNGSCPDCGTMFQIHNEIRENHQTIQMLSCPKCGTEEEQI